MPSAQTAAELIARLNPRAHSWDDTPSSRNHLTPQDIAGAIGMLDREISRLLIRVMYAGHVQHRTKLIAFLCHLARLEPREYAMAELALEELAWQTICLVCNGNRTKLEPTGQNVVCLGCKGTGYRPLPNHARAKRLGIHHETMKRRYRYRYEAVLETVRRLDSEAKAELARKLT